jgi:hypothetical protein
MNDFLHNISSYVINLQHVQARAPTAPSAVTPPLVDITKSRKSDYNIDNMEEDTPPNEAPNWGLTFHEGHLRFNYFGTM